MTPQFQTNISGERMVRMNLGHVCPKCGAEHTVTDWSVGERWVCECGISYYCDPAGRIWEWKPASEVENGESDTTH